ncbi:MAG: glutaminyl-peptide cyclotransferase [Sphingomonas sp.]
MRGIVAWKDKLVQVTWQDHTGFVYGLSDFQLRDSFAYKGEGWGMTQDGTRLILSDGTPTLRFLDPETLKQTGTLNVTAGGCPVAKLNELEWVDGEIYANIWQTNLIARIDPSTGRSEELPRRRLARAPRRRSGCGAQRHRL